MRRPLTSFFSRNTGSIKFCIYLQVTETKNNKFYPSPFPRGDNFSVKVKLMYFFFFKLLLYPWSKIGQTKYLAIMTKEGSIKIVNSLTPRAEVLVLRCSYISHRVKMRYFFKNLPLYSQAQIRQTEGKLMLTKVIVMFMMSGAGFFVLRRGHIGHILEMHYFFKNFLLCIQA